MPRRVFISYHHGNDQYYCDEFRRFYCNDYGIFTDNSLQRALNSVNTTYIDRTVRENYIYGSSITIVFCGRDTRFRKFVDWEISDTLLYDHALLGIIIPGCEQWYDQANYTYQPLLPERLYDNYVSGYANVVPWQLDHYGMYQAIEQAISQKSIRAKNNTRVHKTINGHRGYNAY
jgi:MTH538 TIR-like domain (DUF1863)